MNVLLVTEFFPPAWNAGGTVVSAWSLGRALVRAGVGVTVVTTGAHTGPRGAIPRERTEGGMRIAAAPVARSAGWRAHRYGLAPGIVRDLWRVSGGVDVCVMQGLWTLPVAVASRICSMRDVPYVLSAKGTLEDESLRQKALKKRLYRWIVASRTIRRAAAVHFASARERDRSLGALGGTIGVVIPNAFEVRALEPRRGAELRARLALTEETLLVGMSGRLHPGKGFETIVPALAHCSPKVHLLIFGSDHERNLPGILALAAASGASARVHAFGHLEPSALDRAYASIDLLALPSRSETFGNVVVEALRQGTPVMISDRVPLAPYVESHGLGAVVASLDPGAWASALDRWAASPLRLDREATAALIARDFDLDVMGGRWMEVLASIARTAEARRAASPGARRRGA